MKIILILFTLIAFQFQVKSQDYYKTPKGKKYHTSLCRMVENISDQITLDEAKELGLVPCKICRPQSHNGKIHGQKKPHGESNQKHQCLGLNKKGFRCGHFTKIANSYCYQHRPKN